MKIDVKVKTKSSRSELVRNAVGTYTAFLKSAPVEGAANKELIELLSDEFDVAKSSLKIIKGLHSCYKIVEIALAVEPKDHRLRSKTIWGHPPSNNASAF